MGLRIIIAYSFTLIFLTAALGQNWINPAGVGVAQVGKAFELFWGKSLAFCIFAGLYFYSVAIGNFYRLQSSLRPRSLARM